LQRAPDDEEQGAHVRHVADKERACAREHRHVERDRLVGAGHSLPFTFLDGIVHRRLLDKAKGEFSYDYKKEAHK